MLDSRFGRLAPAGTILRTTAVLAVMALFVAACGGDDDGSTRTTSTGSTTSGATSEVTSTGSTTAETALQTTNDASTTSAASTDFADLTTLPSFRWSMTLTGAGSLLAGTGVPSAPAEPSQSSDFTASGAWIAPDQAQVVVNTGGVEYAQTIKANEQWVSVAGQSTGPVPATDPAASLLFVSSFVNPENVIDLNSMQCGSNENVNGTDTTRCQATEALNEQIVAEFGGPNVEVSEAAFVIWVAAEGNYIVKWQLNAVGSADGQPFDWDFEANITDVGNVGSIEP